MTKGKIKDVFNDYTGNKYIWFDCTIFGLDRVEIKCIDRAEYKSWMMTVPVISDGEEITGLDWAAQTVRPYNPKKDW